MFLICYTMIRVRLMVARTNLLMERDPQDEHAVDYERS